MKLDSTHAVTEAIKATPPLGVGGLTLFGFPLNEVVLLLTAVYTIWLIVEKTPKVLDALLNLCRRFRGRN